MKYFIGKPKFGGNCVYAIVSEESKTWVSHGRTYFSDMAGNGFKDDFVQCSVELAIRFADFHYYFITEDKILAKKVWQHQKKLFNKRNKVYNQLKERFESRMSALEIDFRERNKVFWGEIEKHIKDGLL